MGRITYDLLRRRAEHNEGIVSTLEEVSLHQQNIEKIELLGHACRHLKILYLQNNLIGKLENLHRLKELEYINLAVNNITKIQNLQKCESLRKLDLTVNFIDKAGMLSLHSLKENIFLQDLYLVGNPCCDWDGYRPYVVACIPQLKKLDGKEIKPSERIAAQQEFAALHDRLRRELIAEGIDPDAAAAVENMGEEEEEEDLEENGVEGEDGVLRRPWCPKTRILEHRETERQNREAEEKKKQEAAARANPFDEAPKKAPRHEDFPPLKEGEELRQKNEGDYEFIMRESDDYTAIELEVTLSKFLDTSLVKLDLQPLYIRLLIKGRLLQLNLPEEILVENSTANRSKASGNLLITMPKLDPSRGPNPLLAPPKNPLTKPPAARSHYTGIGIGREGGAAVRDKSGVIDLTNVVGAAARSKAAAAAQANAKVQRAVIVEAAGGGEGEDEDYVPAL